MLDNLPMILSIAFGIITAVMGFLLSRTINENDKKVDMISKDLKELEKMVMECRMAIGVNATEAREKLNSIADKIKSITSDRNSKNSFSNERNRTRPGVGHEDD